MKQKEILSFIFLAEKYFGKKDSEILVNLSQNEISGEIVDISNFLYKIGPEENIIPISRIWDYLLTQVKGRTKNEYLKNLNALLVQYPFPEYVLKQSKYVNPETKELEYYEIEKN